MRDMLQQGSAWLDDMRKENASQTVAYTRGAATANVPATIGRSLFNILDSHGLMIQVEAIDFLISPTDIVLSGVQVEPAAGDTIKVGSLTYQATPFGEEPAWRYCDGYRTTLRVHAKLVKTT